jgi:hypothetical protein
MHAGTMRSQSTDAGVGQPPQYVAAELRKFDWSVSTIELGIGTLQTAAQALDSRTSVQSELFMQPTEPYLSSICVRSAE